MARRRKASIETRVKRILLASIPVVVGVAGVALGIRYFGDKPVISDVREGLTGNVAGSSWFSGWFG